jgi:hypothetical protein
VTERTRHRRLREQGSTDRALPLAAAWQEPEPDPVLPPGIPVPPHIAALIGRRANP